MEEKKTTLEKVEGEVVNDIAVVQPAKMEFRLINPTEDGFLRVIKWNKEELEAAVKQKIASYENVVYTEDNMKHAKEDRAELNRLTNVIDDKRKMVKNIIMQPYTVFDGEIKEVLELIKKPVDIIDKQVKDFENQQKQEKKQKLIEYFKEITADMGDILTFDMIFEPKYLNAGISLKKAKEDINLKVGQFKTDLATIETMCEEKYHTVVKDAYLKSMNISKALEEARRLKELDRKLEEEKARKAEQARIRAEQARIRAEQARVKAEQARIEAEQKAAMAAAEKAAVKPKDTELNEELPFNAARSDNSVDMNETITVSERNLGTEGENVSKPAGNVFKPTENVSKPAENIIAPPAGNAAVRDPFAPKEDAKQCKASFTVYGTKAQIMALKQYMIDNKIKFGKVEK